MEAEDFSFSFFLFSERVRSSSLGCFEFCPRLQGPESKAPPLLIIREGEQRDAAGEGVKPL